MTARNHSVTLATPTKAANDRKSIVRSDRPDENSEQTTSPTLETYGAWQFTFDYFNGALFESALPNPIITLSRQARARGYFWGDKFENQQGVLTHEISMNPAHLKSRDDAEVLSTFVHEMAHHWRHVFGPLNRRGGKGSNGYHDLVWARKMEELGLLPTSTGKPGGAKTGTRVTHMIVIDGPFDVACSTLLASGFQIEWHDAPWQRKGDVDGNENQKPPKKKDRVKFTCMGCQLNAWAKPSARLTCSACIQPMILVA